MAPAAAEFRERNLARLSAEVFDLAVIGGGITGAALARDAAMRGLNTALVDRADFAGATSSRSSKLIHGGLRYLPQAQFRLVRTALRERERLRHLTAPHLVRPLRFLFPFYTGQRPSRLAVYAGLMLYDRFARTRADEYHRRLTASATSACEPALKAEGLRGGAVYLDACADDARVTLENVIDAAGYGAAVANYLEVEELSHLNGQLSAMAVRDLESAARFEVRARSFINAGGPWLDDIRRLDEKTCAPSVRLTKGSHLVIARSRLPVRNCLVLAAPGGRTVFVMPHRDSVLVGTTDTDFHGNCERVGADTADAAYLLDVLGQVMPRWPLKLDDIEWSFAGLRALPRSGHSRPSAVAREEIIVISRSGMVSVAGGKLTTHRDTAARIVNNVMRSLGRSPRQSPTLTVPLPGARPINGDAGPVVELPDQINLFLRERYGTRAVLVEAIAAADVAMGERLAADALVIAAEVIHAVRNEFARTIGDFIWRRCAITWTAPGAALNAAPRVARLMAGELAWDAARERRELDRFNDEFRRGKCF